MNRRSAIFCLLFAITTLQISCTGARINLKADNLKYPVSMSEGMYDERLKLVSDNYGYEIVDEFSFSVSRVTTFWSLLSFGFISLGSDEDISAEINKLVKEKGGDGVVDLQVSKNGLFTFTNILTGAASGLAFTLGGLVYATGKKSEDKTVGRNLMVVSLVMPGAMQLFVSGKVVKYR